jgi:hypothetical protein
MKNLKVKNCLSYLLKETKAHLTINDFYSKLNLIGNIAIRAKLLDSGQEYFYNVFDKKKKNISVLNAFQKVSFISSAPMLANSNKSKSIKRIMGMRNENLDKINKFCKKADDEIFHDYMKVTVLMLRRELEWLSERIPQEKSLFSAIPLTSSSKVNLEDPNHDISSVFHSKLSRIQRFLDQSTLAQKSRARG